MFDFLKKLFGLKKQEESVYIPQEYVVPKKKPVIVDEPVADDTSTSALSIPDHKTNTPQNNDLPKKEIYSIEQEWGLFEENGKTGFIDENGEIIIAAKFDDADDFKKGYAIVTAKGKKGMIDTKGNYILEPVYDYINDEKDGLLKIEKNNRCGFADTKGNIIIPVNYLDAGDFSEGLAWVEKENAMVGFIDKSNKAVIDFIFDYCGDFSEGLASATKYAIDEGQEDKNGFIDTSGKFVITMDYDEAGDFKEGLAPVCVNGKFTFIDKKGKPVCEPIYNDAGNFVSGLSCVQLEDDGKWGYADKTGRLAIPCQFEDTSDFMADEEMIAFVNAQKLKFLK